MIFCLSVIFAVVSLSAIFPRCFSVRQSVCYKCLCSWPIVLVPYKIQISIPGHGSWWKSEGRISTLQCGPVIRNGESGQSVKTGRQRWVHYHNRLCVLWQYFMMGAAKHQRFDNQMVASFLKCFLLQGNYLFFSAPSQMNEFNLTLNVEGWF